MRIHRRVLRRLRLRGTDGMVTAEYAFGILVAVGFAGIMLKVVTSPGVMAALNGVVSRALKA